MENKIISVVSGGFDPIHPGHIMMMKECLEFSNFLIAGVNSNKWLIDKKGNLTRNPDHYFDGGAILPFGKHKGFGLSLIAQLIAESMLGKVKKDG